MAGSRNAPFQSVFEHDPEMAEIVALFVSEMPDRAGELAAALDDGDLETALRIAHQLKGAAGGYGFDGLGEVAAAAEKSLLILRDAPSATTVEALRAAGGPLVEACRRVRLSHSESAA